MSEEKSFTVIFRYAPGHHSYPVMARNETEARNMCYAAFGDDNITVVRVDSEEKKLIAKKARRLIKMGATPEELQKVANYLKKNLDERND